jgi:hypothetical protein
MRVRDERDGAAGGAPGAAFATFTVLALAAALALPGGALADVGAKIIERCSHGQPISGYTVQQYRRALQEMPTEIVEYTDCGELITQAELKAAGHRGGGGQGGGGSAGGGRGGGLSGGGAAGNGNVEIPFLNPAEQRTVEQARHAPAPPIRLGGHEVRPGIVHTNLASAASSLPTPLLVAIALMLAGLLLLAGREAKSRLAGRWERPGGWRDRLAGWRAG